MKTIGELLEKNTSLKNLIKKVQTTKNLADIFCSMLDASFIKHCRFASFQDTVLTVIVTNTSWATKLRYAIPDIIKNLCTQPEFKKLKIIRYAVDQQKSIYKTKNRQTKLSHTNEILWQETLDHLKNHKRQARQ